jgi:hypothetical protein
MCVHEEASNIVEKALQEAITMMDGYDDGDILVEWALVAYVTNVSNEENSEVYPTMFSNGSMATHRAVGLFHAGIDMITGGGVKK